MVEDKYKIVFRLKIGGENIRYEVNYESNTNLWDILGNTKSEFLSEISKICIDQVE